MEDDVAFYGEAMSVDLVSLNTEKNSDLCENLLERYGKSTAESHQRVCASASSIRTQLKEEGKPLIPLSYLDATISAIADTSHHQQQSTPIDPKSTSSLTSFLSILLPLVPSQSLPSSKANDVVTLLVSLFERPQSHVTILNVIKLFGFLIELCDLEDLKCAKSVFEMVLEFSVDKRREVRDCAQTYIVKMYKSVQCVSFVNEASELFYSMFYKYLPFAIAIAWSRIEITEESEQAEELMLMESVHMLSVLKAIVGHLSSDVLSKIMSQIHKVMGSKCSRLTRPLFAFLQASFESPRAEEIIVQKAEIIIFALEKYVSPKWNNPADTLSSASLLLKQCHASMAPTTMQP